MDTKFDLVTIISAISVAAYVAVGLRYLAVYDFRLSSDMIRSAAVVAALLISATLAIIYFGKKSGRGNKRRARSESP
jgi:hypothetical protein